jgi:uncharacterized membrane protein YtjA (UPF0391 family)
LESIVTVLNDDRSGLPLLLTYALLVIISVVVAILGYWALAKISSGVAQVALPLMLMTAMFAPWPVAVFVEQSLAGRASAAAVKPAR